MQESMLKIENLSVHFTSGEERFEAVKDVSLELEPAQTLALVGESGSGKSVTALSVLRLLPAAETKYVCGRILFRDEDLLSASERRLRSIRGNRVGVIFQEPLSSLNPLHTVEKQIAEVLSLHKGMRGDRARKRVLELLELVGIKDPATRLAAYPHEISGGQRQRVMIAMALATEPDLLIADEPTTALDVTIQNQVMDLLKRLQKQMGMAVLFITHDLSVVRNFADRVAVMYQGRIVETANTEQLFSAPEHEYTRMLLEAEPHGAPVSAPENKEVLLQTDNLKVWFPITKGILKRTVDHFKAVNGISLKVNYGHSLGVVGESGSGKTTLGLAVLRLNQSNGEIWFAGKRIDGLRQNKMRPLRREIQVVFQDPFGSLSPRMSVEAIIEEGVILHKLGDKEKRRQMLDNVLREVGLDPEVKHRYPHEFSGGQRQRISIARALVLRPKVMVLDEPTSSLDRSVQGQIIDLLRELQKKYALTYIFISHDLKVVRALCHEVLVMRSGEALEYGLAEEIFTTPEHSYTRELIRAAMSC